MIEKYEKEEYKQKGRKLSFYSTRMTIIKYLRSFTSESSSELQIFRLDGNSFGVDGSQVSYDHQLIIPYITLRTHNRELTVFEERDEVSLRSFLESTDGGRLESNYID